MRGRDTRHTMEKYDKGLGLIADAQAAEKRLSFTEAHSKYMEGIETLLKVSRNETNEETSRMVRGHIARFIDNAGAVADRKDLPTPSPAKQRAERKEEEARKLEQNLKFMVAKTTFTQAAELYYAYRCKSLSAEHIPTAVPGPKQRALSLPTVPANSKLGRCRKRSLFPISQLCVHVPSMGDTSGEVAHIDVGNWGHVVSPIFPIFALALPPYSAGISTVQGDTE